MKVLIEIPDKHRSNIKKKFSQDTIDDIFDYLKKVEKASVEIIPDNATNGDVIKAMYGGMQINDPENENDLVYIEHLYFGFPKYWWDAPYKGGE